MAQIAGSRSEFMTSDLGLSEIEYKRNGGCFLSHKKIAAVIVVFIFGLIAAGVIGAHVSSWSKDRTIASLELAEEDEIDGVGTTAKFSSSPSILPTLYTVQLTPTVDEGTVKKFGGRVIVRFHYNGTESLSQLVLNAKGITVSRAKLFSFDDNVSRKRRDDGAQGSPNSDGSNSSDTTTSDPPLTNPSEVVSNDAVIGNSSSDDDVSNTTSTDFVNGTVLGLSNDNVTADDTASLTTTPEVATLQDEAYGEKNDAVLTASSAEQPVVVQRISPGVTTRPMLPEVSVQGKEVRIAKDETDLVNGLYVIHLDSSIMRGEYSVDITYEAKVDGQSTFANVYELEGQRKWLLATKLKPLGYRGLFPSFDQPNSKARFSLSVARPKTLITLANMPLQSSDSVSDDWVMDHFEKSPPLSPSNLAFLVGDLQPIRETTAGETKIPLTLWGKGSRMEETHFIADKMETVTRTLNQFLAFPYTMPKLDVVGLPGLLVDGVGSTGLISIRESLFYMTEESSAISKELAIKNLVKLIGEQWLGGLVSTKTLSDAWILEGSLIYLQHLLIDKIDPAFDSYNSFGIVQHEALETDAYDFSKTLESKLSPASLETTSPQNSYRKGACLIRMLHNVISDSGFRNGYKKFLSRWTNATPSVSDFWTSMSDEAQSLPDGISLATVMTSWVSQGGFPLVTITRNYEIGSALVRQEKFSHDNSTPSNNNLWYIPLSYISDGDNWSSPRKSWLKKEEEITIEVQVQGNEEEKKWILFNVNQTGYYRVNYDLDNWKLLSLALNSTSEKFPVTTRTSLVDDALSLAWGGRLEYPTALNLIRYLEENETHPSPWTVALRNILKLNNLLQNTSIYAKFQEFMMKFISPLMKKVTSKSEDSQLKLMAIRWACLIDNPECHSYVKNLSIVPEHVQEIYQCTEAKFGGKFQWDSLNSRTSNSRDKETKLKLLAAFPCFQDEWILQSILSDVLNGEKFDAMETLVLLKGFGENPAAARSAFKFLRRNWNEIFQRFSKSYPISKAFLVASINGIVDDQDLKDFQIFKEDNYDKLKFMGHTIAVAEAEARSRISWLKTNLLPVQAWLDDYIRTRS